MRLSALSLVVPFCLGLACSSATDEGERDLRLVDYSLSEVDGQAVPGLTSSLPGLGIWGGEDGSTLTVAQGELSCSADGTGEETYLFRLAEEGSEIWEPIWVDLDVTCELTGPGSLEFQDRLTGEILEGLILERFDGCPVIAKNLPSVESLRAGYTSGNSGAEFPTGLEFPDTLRGVFLAEECLGGL